MLTDRKQEETEGWLLSRVVGSLFCVRLAAHVSNGWKSRICPSSGKDTAKIKGVLFMELLWLTWGESEGRWMNIPDEFPLAVRRYGNHFLDSLLCILNHNFYRDICKGCYAPQMRQGLDKYSHRNRNCNQAQKGDFRVPEPWFPNLWICDFESQEYSVEANLWSDGQKSHLATVKDKVVRQTKVQ